MARVLIVISMTPTSSEVMLGLVWQSIIGYIAKESLTNDNTPVFQANFESKSEYTLETGTHKPILSSYARAS